MGCTVSILDVDTIFRSLQTRKLSKFLIVPHIKQILLIQVCPFLHKSLSSYGEISLQHFKGLDDENGVIRAINGMEMGHPMLALTEVHLNHNAVKSGNGGEKLFSQGTRISCRADSPLCCVAEKSSIKPYPIKSYFSSSGCSSGSTSNVPGAVLTRRG